MKTTGWLINEEVEDILNKHNIEYEIWDEILDYFSDNYAASLDLLKNHYVGCLDLTILNAVDIPNLAILNKLKLSLNKYFNFEAFSKNIFIDGYLAFKIDYSMFGYKLYLFD